MLPEVTESKTVMLYSMPSTDGSCLFGRGVFAILSASMTARIESESTARVSTLFVCEHDVHEDERKFAAEKIVTNRIIRYLDFIL